MRQLRDNRREGSRHLSQAGAGNGVTQVHGGADTLVDLQVARDEGEGGHEVARAPGRGVGLAAVLGVLSLLAHGAEDDCLVVEGEVGGGYGGFYG